MIFETAIKLTVVDKNGNDKVVTNKYIVENAELFGEVESKLYDEFGSETGFEVASIKISKLKEIINEAPQGDAECKIYFATIIDRFYDADKDETTEMQYTVALHAHDMNEAKAAVDQYMRMGLEDMELKAIKETKFINVLG
jgi:ribosomal protein L20A (L18A)